MKLNAVAQKWVENLRSGKYKQAKQVLTKTTKAGQVVGHCCLGVLCDMAVKEGVIKRTSLDAMGHPSFIAAQSMKRPIPCIAYGNQLEILPDSVRKWAGLKTCTGDLRGGYTRNLTSLNDEGHSFKEIADTIVENAEALFVKRRKK